MARANENVKAQGARDLNRVLMAFNTAPVMGTPKWASYISGVFASTAATVSPVPIPALESAHGVAGAIKRAPQMAKNQLVIVNLSGRGDKDVAQAADFLFNGKKP